MVRPTRAAAWLLTYAALVAGGAGAGRALALQDNAARTSAGVMVLAASSNGNGGGHPAFTITSTPVTGLVPGATAKPLSITLRNTDTVAYKVLTLQVAPSSSQGGCSGTTDLVISGLGRANLVSSGYDSSAPGAPPLEIPRKGSLTLTGVTIRMPDLATRQDACKGTTFALHYSGTATQGAGNG